MAHNINIFGTKFAYPRGIRKSPGVNQYNSCVGSKLFGKSGGGRPGVRMRFSAAAKECSGRH